MGLAVLGIWASTQGPGYCQSSRDRAPIHLQTQNEKPRTFRDTAALNQWLRDWRADQQQRGYWEASVDSLRAGQEGQTYRAILHGGPRYEWSELRLPQTDTYREWLRRAGLRKRRPPDFGDWPARRDSLLAEAAAAGYPFASAGLADVKWLGPGSLTAGIAIEPGPFVRLAPLSFPEEAGIDAAFLQRYLGLLAGTPYDGKRLGQVSRRLRQLPYLTVRGEPKITFRDSLAYVDLPIVRRPASRFDFIIGVLPNSNQTGRLLLTGELDGELYNGLGRGERIALRLEQLRPQTQELEVAVDYPFLLGLPFGLSADLDLYRRDSTFLNLDWMLGASYLSGGNDRVTVFWNRRSTIIPGGEPPTLETITASDTLGIRRSFFGVSAQRDRTDRRFSPRRGTRLLASAAAGFRRLEAADSLRTAQYQLDLGIETYFQPFGGTVLYLGVHGGALLSSDVVLANEQYRIGGARTLRGFEEQNVFADDYAILTAEFRLLLGENAFLFTFADAAQVNGFSDYPVGFGAGVNFETRAGVFGLSLALGRREGAPVDLNAPKVHLGYVGGL